MKLEELKKQEKTQKPCEFFCQSMSLKLKAYIDLRWQSLRKIMTFKVTNYVVTRGSSENPMNWKCLEAERILEVSCVLVLFVFHLRYLVTAIARDRTLSEMILGPAQHGCIYFLSRDEKEKKGECQYNTIIQKVLWRQYLGNIFFSEHTLKKYILRNYYFKASLPKYSCP